MWEKKAFGQVHECTSYPKLDPFKYTTFEISSIFVRHRLLFWGHEIKFGVQSERLFIGLLWPSKPTAHLYLKSLNSPRNESCIEYVCFVCSGEGRSGGGMVTIPGGLDLTANNRDGTGETDGLLVKSTPASKATTSGTSNLGGGGVGGGGNSSGNSNGGSRAHRSLHWLYLVCQLFVKEFIDLLGGFKNFRDSRTGFGRGHRGPRQKQLTQTLIVCF